MRLLREYLDTTDYLQFDSDQKESLHTVCADRFPTSCAEDCLQREIQLLVESQDCTTENIGSLCRHQARKPLACSAVTYLAATSTKQRGKDGYEFVHETHSTAREFQVSCIEMPACATRKLLSNTIEWSYFLIA